MNTHQRLWNGRWLLIGNKLEYSVFYGANREIKLHFPCFCISNCFGEPAGWTEEQLHDKSVCVMFYSDDTLRRRQGFKKQDEGNKDISGCFKTECFCPEWRAHHVRIDFSAWWLKYLSDLDISSKQVGKNIIAAMTSRWAISRTGSQPYKGHGVMDRWMVGTYSVNLSASGTDVHFLNLIKRVYVGTPRLNKWEMNASLHRSTTDMQTEAVRWPKVRLHVCKGKLLGCVPQIHQQHLFTGLVFFLRWSKFRQHVPPETNVFIVLLEILEWKKYSYPP